MKTDRADQLITSLKELEPAIMEAGRLARDLQATVTHHQKTQSGNAAVDIISEADVLVQETILAHVLQTPLRACRLLAEEDTPLTKEFPASGQFWLTLDPIDGTQKYVEGGDFFRVMIGLHDRHELLYTFIYFPKLDWWIRATRQTVVRSGTFPRSFPINHPERTVVYNHNFFDDSQLALLGKRLEFEGYQTVRSRDVEPGVGATTFFTSGVVAGMISLNPNAHDGLAPFHIGLAQGGQLMSVSGQRWDLGHPEKDPHRGFYYPGLFAVVRPPVK